MIISLIVAMDRNRLIGNNNQLPWHLPADFAHFKSVTMGKPIVMGRKTYESIGKPLPGRENIVLTRNADVKIEGVTVRDSLEAAIEGVENVDELMIIGGSTIYQQAMVMVDRMYITEVDAEFEGDAWFPEINREDWQLKEDCYREADERNAYACRFITYYRKV